MKISTEPRETISIEYNPEHVTKNHTKFQIRKNHNNRTYYFGSWTKEEVIQVNQFLEEHEYPRKVSTQYTGLCGEVYRKYIRSLKSGKCKWCGKKYIKTTPRQNYCTKNCSQKAKTWHGTQRARTYQHKHKPRTVGTGHLGSKCLENEEIEHEKIRKELGRLGLQYNPNHNK